MKKFFLYLILSFLSIGLNADNFDYQKNLISCQHNFSTCDLSLLKDSDKEDLDLAKIALNQTISLREVQSIFESLNRDTTYLPSSSSKICAENGSCYGDISVLTGRPKTVAVKGYYRKDGTYVRGHYRSKPKKK